MFYVVQFFYFNVSSELINILRDKGQKKKNTHTQYTLLFLYFLFWFPMLGNVTITIVVRIQWQFFFVNIFSMIEINEIFFFSTKLIWISFPSSDTKQTILALWKIKTKYTLNLVYKFRWIYMFLTFFISTKPID